MDVVIDGLPVNGAGETKGDRLAGDDLWDRECLIRLKVPSFSVDAG